MRTNNRFSESWKALEAHIAASKRSSEDNEILTEAFKALCHQLPDAMAVPEIALALVQAVVFCPPKSRPALLRAETALGASEGRLVLAVLRAMKRSGSLPEKLDNIEREIITSALSNASSKGNAAKVLGIPQSTLSTKLRKHALRP